MLTKQHGAFTVIRVYYPIEGKLILKERDVERALSRMATATATVEEFLKGPDGGVHSYVPADSLLLDIYDGSDGILYIDLSDEFQRNFMGDALAEFLVVRGLYESIMANVFGVAEVKLLIEGKEVETLGGHIALQRPLGEIVSQIMVSE